MKEDEINRSRESREESYEELKMTTKEEEERGQEREEDHPFVFHLPSLSFVSLKVCESFPHTVTDKY